MPFLTIFTPVYNRAYIISQLYQSLCRQTCRDFEWVVVNDGSTDDIDSLMARFMAEGRINIRYLTQPNGGKHRAINRGVSEARGSLFFIVDSDDYLTDDAVELLHNKYQEVKDIGDVAGISFMRCTPDGKKIGSESSFKEYCCNAFELTYKLKATGDMAESFKTNILRQYPFPEIENEKFCPEALVWFRIARKYKMLWVNHSIYVCEYLADGLTSSIVRIRHKSPQTSMLFYQEWARDKNSPLAVRIKAIINYWRFSYSSRVPLSRRIKSTGILCPVGMIIGWMMYKKDLKATKQ